MSHPDPTREYGDEQAELEPTVELPSYHWDKIREIAKTLEVQVQDLRAEIEAFKNPLF